MYPSSTSSSSQGSIGNSSSSNNNNSSRLMRYGSAPSSFFNAAVDSVIGSQTHNPTRFFPNSESETTTMMPNLNDTVIRREDHHHQQNSNINGGGSGPSLVRHTSLPTGFLNHLASTSAADNGFSITSAIGSYDFNGIGDHGNATSTAGRLNSQHSFTRQDHQSLSRISEETADHIHLRTTDNNIQRKSINYDHVNNNNMGSWDEPSSTMFSKRAKTFRNGVDNIMESQFQFGMPEATLEMATMENLLQIPQDSIPCKIRAKRGFATHPRSIAERERRTRISGKLKKLQDLVPNMDKQTSYSDMLDLAVQHIKTLQNQLQKLNKENDSCTCGCKKSTADQST